MLRIAGRRTFGRFGVDTLAPFSVVDDERKRDPDNSEGSI